MRKVKYVIDLFKYGYSMPVKKGPYGTTRKYSSSTGRYIKNTFEIQPIKKTKEEIEKVKLQRKLEDLITKINKSKDPLLKEVCEYLINYYPGYIEDVNKEVLFPGDGKNHELDIICKNHIIEVKSGMAKGHATQLLLQKEYAESKGIKAITYAPNILKMTKGAYERLGLIIVTTFDELDKELKK